MIADVAVVSAHMDEAAHALAKVIPVYVIDGGAVPRQLTASEVMGGTFSRGATRFTVRGGMVFSTITVTRHDMRDALSILKKAGIRFP
jgi:hypothetical protein